MATRASKRDYRKARAVAEKIPAERQRRVPGSATPMTVPKKGSMPQMPLKQPPPWVKERLRSTSGKDRTSPFGKGVEQAYKPNKRVIG